MKSLITIMAVLMAASLASAENFRVTIHKSPVEVSLGTGFLVMTKQGNRLGVTAAHVCENSMDNGVVISEPKTGKSFLGGILIYLTFYDLCLFTVPTELKAKTFKLASMDEVKQVEAYTDKTMPDNSMKRVKLKRKHRLFKVAYAFRGEKDKSKVHLSPTDFYEGLITKGTSGAAVFDKDEKVVGVVRGYNKNINTSFIIPVSILERMISLRISI